MKKLYRVSGYTKKGTPASWRFDVEADSAKDAKAIALGEWQYFKDAHLFGAHAHRIVSTNLYATWSLYKMTDE